MNINSTRFGAINYNKQKTQNKPAFGMTPEVINETLGAMAKHELSRLREGERKSPFSPGMKNLYANVAQGDFLNSYLVVDQAMLLFKQLTGGLKTRLYGSVPKDRAGELAASEARLSIGSTLINIIKRTKPEKRTSLDITVPKDTADRFAYIHHLPNE